MEIFLGKPNQAVVEWCKKNYPVKPTPVWGTSVWHYQPTNIRGQDPLSNTKMIYDEIYDEYTGEIPDSFYGGPLPMCLSHDVIVYDNYIGLDKDPTRLPNVIDITNADE